MPEHPKLDVLPEWPIRTIAVLATVDHGPPRSRSRGHGAGNLRIQFSLRRSRGQVEFRVQSGIDRRWVDDDERRLHA